ncbi:MAG: hypothetical protein M0T81_06830 [Thermoplasmatales archaeon]|jgi:hypothetical protein|nr:hypothetical protein [Thermoplasmatales archaeon]
MKQVISVLGDRDVEKNSLKWELAYKISKTLVDHGYRVLTGGVGSLSRAVYEGAIRSSQYTEGCVVSIVPGFDPNIALHTSDIQIATGLDEYRNVITANTDAVVAIGGGAGTLSEIAFAWMLKRFIICLKVDGWSGELAGRKIDRRVRYQNIDEDQCFPARDEIDVVSLLTKYLHRYDRRHSGIPKE